MQAHIEFAMERTIVFRDRIDAGQRLARKLLSHRTGDPVILALPRGGVPVAFEIATALKAPLDLIMVRKIGAPSQPELALGAIADGMQPELFINRDVAQAMEVPQAFIDAEAKRQLAEIDRRRRLYLAGRPPVSVLGKTAMVVDDGIATGATIEAALRSVRKRSPRHLILAVPIAPADTLDRLRKEVDEIVCLSTPEPFRAISMFYERFPQVSDDEVIELLQRASTLTP